MISGTSAIRLEDLPHYTYNDYVKWEGKWELIHGIPYAMAPAPNKIHQLVSGNIHYELKRQLKNCPKCKVFLPVDWPISDDTVVQPDISVICDEERVGPIVKNTPILIVEVLSPSNRRKDRILKYRLYQEAGVKYYCIVEPKANSIEVFVHREDKYWKDGDFKEGKILFDLEACEIQLDLKDIFS